MEETQPKKRGPKKPLTDEQREEKSKKIRAALAKKEMTDEQREEKRNKIREGLAKWRAEKAGKAPTKTKKEPINWDEGEKQRLIDEFFTTGCKPTKCPPAIYSGNHTLTDYHFNKPKPETALTGGIERKEDVSKKEKE